MTYEHDLFISYKRKLSDAALPAPGATWVSKVFKPLLQQRLAGELSAPPRIFFDQDSIEIGAEWPSSLRQALARTKILMPVFTPAFFGSSWCTTELGCFIERERMLAGPHRLIYPVIFSDGKHFPEHASRLQSWDFNGLNYDSESFLRSGDYYRLEQKVNEIALQIAERLEAADFPPCDPTWENLVPLTSLKPPPAAMPLPRM